jgi:hypothetical protein
VGCLLMTCKGTAASSGPRHLSIKPAARQHHPPVRPEILRRAKPRSARSPELVSPQTGVVKW